MQCAVIVGVLRCRDVLFAVLRCDCAVILFCLFHARSALLLVCLLWCVRDYCRLVVVARNATFGV